MLEGPVNSLFFIFFISENSICSTYKERLFAWFFQTARVIKVLLVCLLFF